MRSELAEPVPQRLLDAAKRPRMQPTSNVVNLQAARDARLREAGLMWAQLRPAGGRLAAMAASLVIGFGLGYINRNQGPSDPTRSPAAQTAH